MIQISKEERNIILSALPGEPIAKTRRKYYAPEVYRVMVLLPDNEDAKRVMREYGWDKEADASMAAEVGA